MDMIARDALTFGTIILIGTWVVGISFLGTPRLATAQGTYQICWQWTQNGNPVGQEECRTVSSDFDCIFWIDFHKDQASAYHTKNGTIVGNVVVAPEGADKVAVAVGDDLAGVNNGNPSFGGGNWIPKRGVSGPPFDTPFNPPQDSFPNDFHVVTSTRINSMTLFCEPDLSTGGKISPPRGHGPINDVHLRTQ